MRFLPFDFVFNQNEVVFNVKLEHTNARLTTYFIKYLRGTIDPIGTICIGKGWVYGPIPSPKIREYPRTTSKGRDEKYTLKRGKEYLCRI